MRRQNISYAVMANIELHRAVVVTEAIRAITDSARQVNMAALNARLLSWRSGNAAVGFGVTSNSLRTFASVLSADMAGLIALTSHLVGDIAFLMRYRMRMARLRRALEGSKDSLSGSSRLSAWSEQEAGIDREIRQNCVRIHRAVLRSIKLCDMGISQSRSANIEAVHGGAISGALSQVAAEIGVTIEEIRKNLKVIHLAITEE